MKPHKWITLAVLTVVTVSFLAAPAMADRGRGRNDYRRDYHHSHHHPYWGGVAAGVGAAILGTALLAPIIHAPPTYSTVIVKAPPPRCSGHWESRDIWVPSTSERVWNPAHYDRHGRWVEGHWIEREGSPGHYENRRVWVEECR
jgi:hypothetical protein